MSVILIHQILEELKQTNEKDCCRICENLLEKLTSQKDCLFVVTYMIEHLTGVLTEERVDVLHQTQIGCEVSSCQHTYPHPLLLPTSGHLSVITLIYTFIYLVLILCFMSIHEYNILPFICFEIMYILHINIIGLQMLLCMPEPFVCDYRPLVSEPKLMLEQLLMNMKV